MLVSLRRVLGDYIAVFGTDSSSGESFSFLSGGSGI